MNNKIIFLLIAQLISAAGWSQSDGQQRWKEYLHTTDFRSETDKINKFNVLDIYKTGHKYDILIVYPDSISLKTTIEFVSIMDLCHSDSPLIVQSVKNGQLTAGHRKIEKAEIQLFIFDNTLLFKKNRQKEYKLHASDPGWAIVEINGPVMVTKRYYLSLGSLIESQRVVKDSEFIGMSPESIGGFFFKKSASKLFSDHPELSKKIFNKEKGYTSKYSYKIIKEYNEWVKESDQKRYAYYLFH